MSKELNEQVINAINAGRLAAFEESAKLAEETLLYRLTRDNPTYAEKLAWREFAAKLRGMV